MFVCVSMTQTLLSSVVPATATYARVPSGLMAIAFGAPVPVEIEVVKVFAAMSMTVTEPSKPFAT